MVSTTTVTWCGAFADAVATSLGSGAQALEHGSELTKMVLM